MEQFIEEVQAYAAARGLKPSTVVQYAARQSAARWQSWVDGEAQCLPRTMERVRRYMAENPPQEVA